MPGELRGLELAHRKFGKLSWDAVFQPAAKIADEGFVISHPVDVAINAVKSTIVAGNYTGMKYV